MRGVSREGAIADYGVMFTGELDHDLESHAAAAAEVFLDRGPGYVRLSGRVSFADDDIVAQ